MTKSESIRILCMEDDPGLARLFQKKLERAGYVVDLARDGEEGLAMCKAGSYDVVVVDQSMPVHDGLEVIRILASRGPLPPTIMITGNGNEQIAVAAMKLGAQDYIVKDVNGGYLELLPAVIEQVLHQQWLAEGKQRAEKALRQYAAELEARNEELDTFAHTVAHDLKEPLSNVVSFAEILAEDYATLPEEKQREFHQWIVRSGQRMSNIIDELLLLASVRRMEEVAVEPLDMASIVAETQERLGFLIEEHQAEMLLPDTWPVALGYAPWVEEVWANYVSNAIRYGGRPPRVELGAEVQTEGIVRFWVRDNGHGIPPEEQARLFTPFTRLDQVRAKGHGLGLSIVGRIVEKLGGQVGVESELGKGSTFFFTLPAPGNNVIRWIEMV